MNSHSFELSIAIDFDVETALLLNSIAFWIKTNRANKKHIHDGRCWLYNSYEAWTILFPYWSAKQMRRILTNAENYGLISTGNYNKRPSDLTKWYTLTDKALLYFPILKALLLNTPAQTVKTPAQTVKTPAQTGNALPDPLPDPLPSIVCGETSTQPISFEDYKTHELDGLNYHVANAGQEKMEREAFDDPDNQADFEKRFKNRTITYEKMFKACKEHFMQKGQWVGSQRFNMWINRESPENYPQRDSHEGIKQSNPVIQLFTPQELEDLAEFKHWQRCQSNSMTLEAWIPNPEKRARAIAAYQKDLALMNKGKDDNALALS